MNQRVLVTDGSERSALACVRALGRRGCSCYSLGPDKGNLAGASRYCRESLPAPDPLSHPREFLQATEEAIRRWDIDTLFPITEKSLRVILPHRDRMGGVSVPFPTAEVFSTVSDKEAVLEAAEEVGLRVPRQVAWGSRESALEGLESHSWFPVATKASRSVAPGTALKAPPVAYLSDRGGLRNWVEGVHDDVFPVLLQERISGPGVGVFLLLWNGQIVAASGHTRLREKPPSGGVSVLRESAVPDPTLLDLSTRLLKRLGWERGVAMVEFKEDESSGEPVLMEINGRFWGSLQLAIDCGVDFPALLLQCEAGAVPEKPLFGEAGVRTRWLLGDLDHLLLRLFRSKSDLDLPDNAVGKIGATMAFLSSFGPRTKAEVFKFTDPRPFFMEAGMWVRQLLAGGR